MSQNVKGMKIAILATNGFEQSELMEPRKALVAAQARTIIASIKGGNIRGWQHTEWGSDIPVDLTLEHAQAEDFDALLLPGGVMNPDKLRMDSKAVEFVKGFFDAGKPVAAICHGPWMVVEAGAAKGRKMTSWPSIKTDILNAGGNWVDEEAVTDRNLVTSRKPGDIPAFNKAMLKLFSTASKTSIETAA